jgi:2-keto-3-deoxy-L-rhamnonate aldolase RhmA
MNVADKAREHIAASRLPPLGLHILRGAGTSLKFANMVAGVEQAVIAPAQMIARLSR